jgi:hypothetical protein
MKKRLKLVCSMLLVSVGARAQQSCPWLTEGTASALLGAPVVATSKYFPTAVGSCEFTLKQGTATYLLEIAVTNQAHQECPAASQPLPGIGNEAVTCRVERPQDETTDIVGGRVRNVYFRVSLTSKGKAASLTLSPQRRQKVVQGVAEQVASSLF